MSTVRITYVGPFGEVEFAQGSLLRVCRRGEVVEVPARLAYGDGLSLGGLLDQEGNWQPADEAPISDGPADEAPISDGPAVEEE